MTPEQFRAHAEPVPRYEDDENMCACPTCINEPPLPGKRPVTEAQRRDRLRPVAALWESRDHELVAISSRDGRTAYECRTCGAEIITEDW